MNTLTNNVLEAALIFEGGGMRNSYSSGFVNVLLENGIYFNNVYGLSAGATNVVNYVSRDTRRSEVSFTEYVDDLSFRRVLEPLLHADSGSRHQKALDDRDIPFSFDMFQRNPARAVVQAVDRDTGETISFDREDYASEEELMDCVRASTSYPIIMPPKKVGGRYYYDGGVGNGGGIMVPKAWDDGFDKYVVVCTQPKGYRKPRKPNHLYDVFFWHRLRMKELFHTWSERYNEELDNLEELERRGQAYVFYANSQSVSNVERDVDKLKANFNKGYNQAQRELDALMKFLA